MRRRRFMETAALALAGGALACAGAGSTGAAPVPAAPGEGPLDAAAFRAGRRWAATRFGRIAYLERGRGEAALFLHGFPLSGFQWRGAIERLAPYRRCLAPDFLGLGDTEVAEGQAVGPDDQLAMVVAFLDRLGVRRVDVVASDSGGAVAQLMLVRHPERVRSLLLANCDTEHDSPPPALLPVIELARAGRFADEWLAPWLADPILARSPAGIGGMCYVDPRHPTDEALAAYLTPVLGSARRKALVHAYAVALERNPLEGIGPALRRSTVPVRIVWGMADTIFSPAAPDQLDRALGRSLGVRRLEDGKLFWPEERPDVVAEEARRLWAV